LAARKQILLSSPSTNLVDSACRLLLGLLLRSESQVNELQVVGERGSFLRHLREVKEEFGEE